MGVRHRAAFWLGAVCVAALTAGAGLASEVSTENAQAEISDAFPNLPEPPEASVVVRAQDTSAPVFAIPAPPDAPVVLTADDRLQAALATRFADAIADTSPRLSRSEKEAIADFYAKTGYKPLWVKNGAFNSSAKTLIARLKAAHEEGLDPADYPIPAVASPKSPVEDWAAVEVKLSANAVLYAQDARGGRIDPSRLSGLITPKLEIPDPAEVLGRLAAVSNPGAVLASYNPQHPGYRALKLKLAEIRTTRPGTPMVRVPAGPTLRVGMRDPRVGLIRARFGLDPAPDQTAYDERVASAIAAFQKEQGLRADGVLTPRIAALLSGPSPARIESDIIANMERWRWLPSRLGERHILVNIPEYRLRLFKDGDVVHQARVVVGKKESATPVFSDEMEHVIVNPSWTIPPSIMKNEILPGLARDPSYAARRGYEVIRHNGRISVRQPPGARNALGYVKFIFPNDHAVYLHDTPSRHLFGSERRAFSHGCVRVDQPFQLAEKILQAEGWSEGRLKGLIGKGERHIRVKEPLPVHLAYFTLAVDDHGQLKSFDDLYGHNAKVRSALALDS